MRTIKVFIRYLFCYSELKKWFSDYKMSRIKLAIMMTRWIKNKSSETFSTSEEHPEWRCVYMNEPIPKERRAG